MELQISPDNNYAWLTIFNEIEIIDENELVEFLNMAGIRYGFENATEENVNRKKIKKRDAPFLIAKGSAFPPKPKFELFFDPENTDKIESNQVLARLVESEEKVLIGKNIFGEEITGGDYKFTPELYCGENCQINGNNEIISKIAGKPLINSDKIISVQAETIFDSIIDKKLTFESDLIINGEINGSKLMINGNLTVYGDIVNCSDGIYVNGDVKFFSGDHSTIISSGKINFDKCKFCNLIADKRIIGNDDSSIVGGFAISGEQIEVDVLGNEYKELTSLEIAIAPYLKEQIKLMSHQLQSINLEMKPEEMEILREEKQEMEDKFLHKITQSLSNPKPYSILIREKVFPRVFLRVMNKSQKIDKLLHSYRFPEN